MNFNFGVFLIQSVCWLALLFAGFGFIEGFGISEWEYIGGLSCLAFSAFLVDERFALALLPLGYWNDRPQKK